MVWVIWVFSNKFSSRLLVLHFKWSLKKVVEILQLSWSTFLLRHIYVYAHIQLILNSLFQNLRNIYKNNLKFKFVKLYQVHLWISTLNFIFESQQIIFLIHWSFMCSFTTCLVKIIVRNVLDTINFSTLHSPIFGRKQLCHRIIIYIYTLKYRSPEQLDPRFTWNI